MKEIYKTVSFPAKVSTLVLMGKYTSWIRDDKTAFDQFDGIEVSLFLTIYISAIDWRANSSTDT